MDSEKKLRVLHSAALLRPPSGILNQMRWEQEAADKLCIPWQVKMYCPLNSSDQSSIIINYEKKVDSLKIKNKLHNLVAWITLRKNYHKWLMSLQGDIDIFILRYYVHDPFQLWFVRNCTKPVYFVHHSLEVPELALPGNISSIIRSKLESFIGNITLPHTKGIIGVTEEIVNHQKLRFKFSKHKPNYVYPNGIAFSNQPSLEDKRSKNIPELLFVANFAPWHGLDLLLKSVQNCKKEFILHLVGKIPEELIDGLKKDKRIMLHGSLSHPKIKDLSLQCWVGLASFAFHRLGMEHACPLKVREYLMMGLPTYGNYQDTFPKKSHFFKKGTEDISQILEYAQEVRKISKEIIHNDAKMYINKKHLLTKLHADLLSHNQTIDYG